MSSSEVFQKFYVKLVIILPMNDSLFLAKLFACGLLPGDLKQKIKAEKTPVDKATCFLDDRISSDISIGYSTTFNELLNVMEDSENSLKVLAAEIKTALKERSVNTDNAAGEPPTNKIKESTALDVAADELHKSPDAQAPAKGPNIKMFSPEQVTVLTHILKELIDNYSDGASDNQQSGTFVAPEGKQAETVPGARGKGKNDNHVMAYDKDSPLNDSIIYAKSQEDDVIDELADSLQQMKKDPKTIREESLSQFKLIGHGNFGAINSAVYSPVPGKTIKVVIKKAIDCSIEDINEDFLREIAVMATFVHPNIVRVFGLVDKGGSSSPWLVLEYLPNGDLKSFLMKNPRQVNQLVKYMIDVAMGMHYLSEKSFVHRDLAARNVLMDQNELCKVGDFEMLRKTTKDEDGNYSYKMDINSKVALPVRWMAIETMTEQNFSSASDVWSFGVLMWELFNPHLIPYGEVTNIQVIKNVMSGKRLEIPQQCPEAVAQVMRACWIPNHTKRPSFLVIANLLQHSMMQMEPAGSK